MCKILVIIFVGFFSNCCGQSVDSLRVNTNAPDSILIESRRPVVSKADLNDSAYLRVRIFQTGYRIYLRNDSLSTGDTTMIDKFISTRIDFIDKNKVFVIGDPNARYANFRPLKNIFKKYEIFRFKIVTD
ncbi:hypothetical protein BH11BAC4_BH11BAC4_09300 [soil metagenome]